MGVLSGTLSYMRYFVEGQSPFADREAFLERVQHHATPELTADSEDEQVSGWALIDNVLSTDFRIDNVFYNEYILLSLRVDSWKIPSALLKAHQYEAERLYMEEQGREKLGKREKTQIRDQVKKQLKSQHLPSLSTYDVCWQPDTGLLRFWSLSSRVNEMFIELFEKTFELHLVPQTPYTLAERAGWEEDDLAQMARLEPQAFATDEL